MNNKNFEYTGWKINGFVALVIILATIVGSVFMIVKGADAETAAVGLPLVIGGVLLLLLSVLFVLECILGLYQNVLCYICNKTVF